MELSLYLKEILECREKEFTERVLGDLLAYKKQPHYYSNFPFLKEDSFLDDFHHYFLKKYDEYLKEVLIVGVIEDIFKVRNQLFIRSNNNDNNFEFEFIVKENDVLNIYSFRRMSDNEAFELINHYNANSLIIVDWISNSQLPISINLKNGKTKSIISYNMFLNDLLGKKIVRTT